MSMSRLGRRTGQVVGLVAAVALLAGCGDAHPGVAVKAGDQTITVRDVDSTVTDYCAAIEDQLKSQQQVVPLRFFRSGIAGILAQRTVAEQLAAEYDVEPGKTYDEKVAELTAQLGSFDDDVRDAVLRVESSSAYVEGVEEAVGAKLLAADGTTDAEAAAKIDRGKKAFDAWVSDNGVSFDPQFGVEMVKGGEIKEVDTSVSYAVGESAKNGAAEQPDPAYTKSLPAAHSCG